MKKNLLLCFAIANALTVQSLFASSIAGLVCPPDTTVDCDAEIWDLSGYGDAILKTYTDTLDPGDPEVEYHLNDCNIGVITRTWSAYDPYGHYHTCTQTITVTGTSTFGEHNINWPPDYMTDECGASLDPDDLPEPFNAPTWDDVSCSMIMYNHKDLDFYISDGCVKILRKWSLLDWCTYDPNSGSNAGRWEYTQVLKIMTLDEPEIICIPDVTVSSGAECGIAYVQLGDVTGSTICGAGVTITNNSPYADDGGANASGTYPQGTTEVKFTAEDGCGNKTYCKVNITVLDLKQPTPICMHGISATLSVMSNGYYTVLFPELFDRGSYDNCTPKDKLKFWVEPDTLWCSDLDTADVRVYVEDESGNVSYCETYVYLTDNQDKCPNTGNFTVNGSIQGPNQMMVNQGTISFNYSGGKVESVIQSDGTFTADALKVGQDYQLQYVGEELYEPLSTLDQVYLIQSLLGQELLSDQRAIASADLDEDGIVTAYDAYLMQQIILGKLQGYGPNQYLFIDRMVPYNGEFKLPSDMVTSSIRGLQRDEVLSKSLLILQKGILKDFSTDVPEIDEPLVLSYDAHKLLQSDELESVELITEEDVSLWGGQFSFNLPKDRIEELEIHFAGKPLNQDAYDWNMEDGILRISIALTSPIEIASGSSVIRLNVRLTQATTIQELVQLNSSENWSQEVYTEDFKTKPVTIDGAVSVQSGSSEIGEEIQLHVYPNPLKRYEDVRLRFDIPQSNSSLEKNYQASVVSIAGQTVISREVDLNQRASLSALEQQIRQLKGGVYIIHLVSKKHQFAERLMIHE